MRRALIVGIDHYKNSPLEGCVNDANLMYEVLSRHEDDMPNFDCRLMVSDQHTITITRLKKQIYNLLYQEGEVAVFYFSGHGLESETSSCLVTPDAKKYLEGVSLDWLITVANSSKVNEVVIILDCCHSGHLGNLREFGGRKAVLREGVSILTSSRDSQYAVEEDGNGIFTRIIAQALKGGAADLLGKVNVSRIYNYVDQLLSSWEQRPIFKSHVSKMVTLRKCHPKIKLEKLRKITEYFPDKDYQFPLDPSYDDSLEPKNEENEAIMAYLRLYYQMELLVPIGEKYMYPAARDSKPCKLTLSGQYYWGMVKKDQI